MKINASRLFTHPVLAEGRDDYRTCEFAANLKYFFDAADNLVLEIDCRTDCAEIKQLIASGDAEYLLHVECPQTNYREKITRYSEKFSHKVSLSRVKENIHCVAFIVLHKDIKAFSCADWNGDFDGLSFDLQKGSVLAYQNFQPLPLPDDPNIFKNVGSIFSIYKKIGADAFEVDMDSEKIKIALSEKDYALYRRYCSKPEMQPILNAMIILPALIYVFEDLKADEDFETYGDKAWFLSLAAAYRRKKINFAEHIIKAENTSIKLAQEVMNLPLTKALENIVRICDETAEDS